MNILVVKLSSLGDVVHAMPAVQDLRRALPQAGIDWVVEPAFAPLVQRCRGVRRVIACGLRQWRRAPLAADTWQSMAAFRRALRQDAYDAVIDLQGLSKSALVARMARLSPGGRRIALGNRTEGSGWEAPTRWVADFAPLLPVRIGAVQRSRALCAAAFGYPLSDQCFGLETLASHGFPAPEYIASDGLPTAGLASRPGRPTVLLVHGSSRADKGWPLAHWQALAGRLLEQGFDLALPQGSDAEARQARAIAAPLRRAQVWPRVPLDQLLDAMAGCAGVIGVDSGLSHMAVALDLPNVQIYNHDTAWRTGPPPWPAPASLHGSAAPEASAVGSSHQFSLQASPTPDPETVWQAWQAAWAASPGRA